MTIGNRIKQRRLELNLSVDELAKKLNKNRATIYRYESDDIENFPTTVLEPLAKALDTTPAYLMGWEQNWDNEVKDFFDKTNAFEAELNVLGWTYELVGCQDWIYIDDGSMGLDDDGRLVPGGKGRPVGCDTIEYGKVKCENCPERYAYYRFTNDQITFKVSLNDYDTFIMDSQTFFKERLQQLLKKSMKQMFTEKTIDNKSHTEPQAAHERTDIEVTEEMRKHDDDIMDDDNFWNK